MAEKKKAGPVKLPLNPTDALRALLQVKPPDKQPSKKPHKGKPKKAAD
jgi:hypothetical protein